ncbi:MAG: ABC transporter permease [Clostridiales bacterium]|nr:ABC transporter permease [Clostridiales bacterium]
MTAIFKREFKSYFTSPIGYAILVASLLVFGIMFSSMYAAGSAEIAGIFSNIFTVIAFMVVIIPILTMRLLSEEKRLKTDQALLTAPVGVSAIVLGKFFAAFLMFAVSVSITLIFQIIVSCYVSADWMVYLNCLIGMLLFGGALIAIGLFISSLTESPMVAVICSFAVSLALLMLDFAGYLINNSLVTKLIGWISFSGRYNAFTSGVFDYSNAVFFLSVTAVFLFFAVRVLESKRWA